ncbi:MAG: DNA-3-methyladenine glycosylase I [Bdellovibrionales bacterium]|nr:DNA-3-methyladenine glycosylase I [Bdellovibrionales bacterium]
MGKQNAKRRCEWVPQDDPLYQRYHDREWGVPLKSRAKLFEMLLLEGAQAGLSWRTVLHKRENYRRLFADFDPEKVARFTDAKLEKILLDPGIIRNRLKVYGFRKNARAFLRLEEESGDFSKFIWSYVGGKPIQNKWKNLKEVPSETEYARSMSKDLKRRGFTFVGPSICYAFMQACGMVNDHAVYCFCYKQTAAKAERF